MSLFNIMIKEKNYSKDWYGQDLFIRRYNFISLELKVYLGRNLFGIHQLCWVQMYQYCTILFLLYLSTFWEKTTQSSLFWINRKIFKGCCCKFGVTLFNLKLGLQSLYVHDPTPILKKIGILGIPQISRYLGNFSDSQAFGEFL